MCTCVYVYVCGKHVCVVCICDNLVVRKHKLFAYNFKHFYLPLHHNWIKWTHLQGLVRDLQWSLHILHCVQVPTVASTDNHGFIPRIFVEYLQN